MGSTKLRRERERETHFGVLGIDFESETFLNDKVMRILPGFWKDLSGSSSKSGFGFAIKEDKAS